MMESTKKTIEDIKSIKIQGASNIVLAAYDVIINEVQNHVGTDFDSDFDDLIKSLWKTRPTEPALKNFLTTLKQKMLENAGASEFELKEYIIWLVNYQKKKQLSDVEKVTDVFVNSVTKKTVVFTHCHSSIVEKAIIKLHQKGLLAFAVNTESRPLYQGRTTASNLSNSGIEVYHVIDSLVFSLAKQLIKKNPEYNFVFLTGSDVITKNGDLVNKVGTSEINFCLKSLGIKHYVLSTSAKVDVVDSNWTIDDVELRDESEVWDKKPSAKIKILNYAFDITPSDMIDGFCLENGFVEPKDIKTKFTVSEDYRKIWDKYQR